MIVSFRHRGLKKLFYDDDASKVSANYRERIENILFALDQARTIDDLRLPGNRLHALVGDMKGCWSITVSANWRIVFRFEDGEVSDIDLIDYR